MLADRHQQLDHHNSGRRRLSAEVCTIGGSELHRFRQALNYSRFARPQEHATVTRQVDTFARKLVQMKSSDPEVR